MSLHYPITFVLQQETNSQHQQFGSLTTHKPGLTEENARVH